MRTAPGKLLACKQLPARSRLAKPQPTNECEISQLVKLDSALLQTWHALRWPLLFNTLPFMSNLCVLQKVCIWRGNVPEIHFCIYRCPCKLYRFFSRRTHVWMCACQYFFLLKFLLQVMTTHRSFFVFSSLLLFRLIFILHMILIQALVIRLH